jgi:hypothetical protein
MYRYVQDNDHLKPCTGAKGRPRSLQRMVADDKSCIDIVTRGTARQRRGPSLCGSQLPGAGEAGSREPIQQRAVGCAAELADH